MSSSLHIIFAILSAVVLSNALNPIEIKGYKFFDSVTGEELVIRGIDYYPRPNTGELNANSLDLFTDKHRRIWERDIPYLQELGVNAIRLYAVDPEEDHDAFMCALNQAGIYVLVAMARDCPTCAITRDETPGCYPVELKIQGQAVINAFAKYPNTLAFSAGNEVNQFAPPSAPEWNALCLKKFLRDMREYIDSCDSLRNVPIGLVSADENRDVLALYHNCRSDPQDKYENTEWYGINSYVFCDGKAENYSQALGYQLLEQSFQSYNYSVPVLLTEFGCLSVTFPTINGYPAQRNFLQAKWLLEERTSRDYFNGGFAFEYSIEMENAKSTSPFPFTTFGPQNYGVGYFSPENCDDINIPCNYHPFPTFDKLKAAYTATKVLDPLTKDTFQIPQNRMMQNHCPEQFKPLSQFNWNVDSIGNLKCPTMTSDTNFQCPANYEELFNKKKQEFTNRTEVDWLLFALATAGIILAAVWALQMIQGRDDSWIISITLRKKRSGEVDSTSEESAELFSMQNLVAKYHAVDSTSSNEDLAYQRI